jgi:hypothetical protein
MTVRLGLSLLLAVAGCGGFLATGHGPHSSRAAAAENISFAPEQKSAAFPGTCSVEDGAATDSRPDPAWISASYENDNCWAPALPARLNGQTASREAIMAYTAAEKRYDAGAAAFQRCIQHFVSARSAQRKQSLDAALVTIENHRIIASSYNQKKLSAQVALAVMQFNAYGSDCPD